jgi:hypothetical protein
MLEKTAASTIAFSTWRKNTANRGYNIDLRVDVRHYYFSVGFLPLADKIFLWYLKAALPYTDLKNTMINNVN